MRIIVWILSLYPYQWRERYQDEMLALLEQHTITWKTSFDLLLGALDARLDPAYRGEEGFLLQRWHDRQFLSYIYISALAVFFTAINCWTLTIALLDTTYVNVPLDLVTVSGPSLSIYLLFIPLLINTILSLKNSVKKRSKSVMLYTLICLGCSIMFMYPIMNFEASLPQNFPFMLIISILTGISGFMALFTIGVRGAKQLKARQRRPVFFAFVIGFMIPIVSDLYQYMLMTNNIALLHLLLWTPYEAVPYLSIAALVMILADISWPKQGWRVMQGIGIMIALYTVIASAVVVIVDYNFLIVHSMLIMTFPDGLIFSSDILIVNTLVLISMLILILFALIRTFIIALQPKRRAMVMEQMTKY